MVEEKVDFLTSNPQSAFWNFLRLNSSLSLNNGWKVWVEVKMVVVVICLLKILVHKKRMRKKWWRTFLVGFIFLFRWFFGLIRPVVLLCKLFSKFPSFGKFLRFYSFFGNLFLERRILLVSAWRIQMMQIQFSCPDPIVHRYRGRTVWSLLRNAYSLVLIEPFFQTRIKTRSFYFLSLMQRV